MNQVEVRWYEFGRGSRGTGRPGGVLPSMVRQSGLVKIRY